MPDAPSKIRFSSALIINIGSYADFLTVPGCFVTAKISAVFIGWYKCQAVYRLICLHLFFQGLQKSIWDVQVSFSGAELDIWLVFAVEI